jgi:hypothetical protein
MMFTPDISVHAEAQHNIPHLLSVPEYYTYCRSDGCHEWERVQRTVISLPEILFIAIPAALQDASDISQQAQISVHTPIVLNVCNVEYRMTGRIFYNGNHFWAKMHVPDGVMAVQPGIYQYDDMRQDGEVRRIPVQNLEVGLETHLANPESVLSPIVIYHRVQGQRQIAEINADYETGKLAFVKSLRRNLSAYAFLLLASAFL